MTSASPDKFEWIDTEPGVRRRTIACGEKLFQMLVEFQPGATTPKHQHHHEQIAHVIHGRLRLLLDDRVVELSAGESFCLASNVAHGAECPEKTLLLDTFTPPREDLLAIDFKKTSP